MDIRFDTHVGGITIFDGPHKLAVVTTDDHQGVSKHGVLVYERMPPESWTIHLTTPMISVQLLQAVLDVIPKAVPPK